MRLKAVVLLTLLSMLLGVTGCGEKAWPTPIAPDTSDPADIALLPYTSEEMGFTSVVPDGWVEFSLGHFQPEVPSTEPTLFAQFGLPGGTMEQLSHLLTLAESVGSRETSSLTWDLYSRDVEVPGVATIIVELALAEARSGACAIVLASLSEDHEMQREALLLPALEALVPAVNVADTAQWRPKPTPTVPLAGGPTPIDTQVRSTDGMVMVLVPASEFEMGSDAIWRWSGSLRDGTLNLHPFPDLRPQHTVFLDAFWIDQTEVTVGMFRTFVDATGYVTTAEREGYGHPYKPGPRGQEWPQVPGADWQHPRGPGSEAQDGHPVVQVSWEDAADYCAWAGGGLPTEAQWEKACRGEDARLYPWGNEFDGRRMNFCSARCPVTRWASVPTIDDGHAYTSPVGSYPEGASPYGAMDMAGNVWEWTADRYGDQYYASSPYENPQGPETGEKRVQHGGAWYETGSAGWLTCLVRHATPPRNRADDLGFRCAVPAQGGSL
jgi:formylglycine-generating enzyme required for sulfatase activity